MKLLALVDRLRSYMTPLRAQLTNRVRGGVSLVAAGLCLATFGPALVCAAGAPLSFLETFVFQACAPFCHQLPNRSFQLAGHALPLCTRCTGMWIGITVGIALGVFTTWKRRWSVGWLMTVVALGLSELDHLHEQAGRVGWPWVRFSLGLFAFLGVTLAVSSDLLALLAAAFRKLAGWPSARSGRSV